MKNKELQELLRGIDLAGSLKGIKFAYAMAKNRNLIKQELTTLQEIVKPNEKYSEYENKRIKLCEEYADKDEKGKPKMEILNEATKEYVISDRKGFDKALEDLRKEYKEVLDERDAQIKEVNELLEKESDLVPFMVEYEDLPQDITGNMLSLIINLVKEPVKK